MFATIRITLFSIIGFVVFASSTCAQESATNEKSSTEKQTLNALFIGNSYTARHQLSKVLEKLAEAGNPSVDFVPHTVIYGGRTLSDHWRYGTQHVLNRQSANKADVEQTLTRILELQEATARQKQNKNKTGNDKRAIANNKAMIKELESNTKFTKWDIVVLQSYRDDLEGDESFYAEFAPKYAELAKRAGARVILYETTPTTQNAEPLASPPDSASVMKKAISIADLANRCDAKVAPMSLAAFRCQTERPDLTLRFINDAHLNQTLSYMTACSLYAAIFNKSPQGLDVNSVTDIRFLDNENKDKDRDGLPITKVFSDKDRDDLQRFAWETYQQFEKIRTVK